MVLGSLRWIVEQRSRPQRQSRNKDNAASNVSSRWFLDLAALFVYVTLSGCDAVTVCGQGGLVSECDGPTIDTVHGEGPSLHHALVNE